MSRVPATPQRVSSAKKHTEMGKSPTVPATSPAARPSSCTPVRPSTLSAKQSNSTPRNRQRPPTQRSLSTPLSRSLSVRVSKKERRWSERQSDPKSPSTTYTDDYQPPEEVSDKVKSLNLEISGATAAISLESKSPTTYRESFRWPKGRRPPCSWLWNTPTGGNTEQGGAKDTTKNDSTKPSVTFTVGATDKVKPDRKTNAGNGLQLNSVSDPSSATSTEPPSQRPVLKKANSQPVKQNGNGGPHSLPSPNIRPSSASSNEDNGTAVKLVGGRETLLKAASGGEVKSNSRLVCENKSSSVITNGIGQMSLGGSQPSHNSRPASGSSGANVSSGSEREIATPRRNRSYQLQSSSSAGSPFVYGSGSGSWI